MGLGPILAVLGKILEPIMGAAGKKAAQEIDGSAELERRRISEARQQGREEVAQAWLEAERAAGTSTSREELLRRLQERRPKGEGT